MKTSSSPSRALRLSTLLLALAGASGLHAGECPADKLAANALAQAPSAPMGVKDTELASIDLGRENVKLEQRRLRMRHMTIAPGGVVPLHSHEDRPALIMVTSGEVMEYSSKCSVGIVHKAGDVAREFQGTQHWWKNLGKVPVNLTIADVVNDKKPETMQEHM